MTFLKSHVAISIANKHAFKEEYMMHKAIISMMAVLFSVTAFAASPMQSILQASLKGIQGRALINWTVGDTASYNMNMGFIKGSMVMTATAIDSTKAVMTQDVDLGFMGKQQMEVWIDVNTGEILKVIANGQEQQIPEQDMELIEIITDTVTVPAGTFECQHVRLKDNKSGGEVKMWANQDVALSGMVKSIQPGQFGEVTLELTSFNKQ
jgi:hypothetical protein